MKTRTKKILLHILSVGLIAALFFFLGRELASNWKEIRTFSFHFDILLLIIASLVYMLSFVLFALGWHMLLRLFKYPLSFFDTIIYFFITLPAKYVPGKVWIAITRMKFCKIHTIPNSITLLTTGAEAVMEIFAGVYVSLIALIESRAFGNIPLWVPLLITAVGILLLIPKIFYSIINLYLKIVRHPLIPAKQYASFFELFILQLNYACAMVGVGLSQFLFLQSFAPVSAHHFALLVSIGAFSYVASILALFTPNGLGVREGIWYVALRKITAHHIAIIYAFASRLWTIAVEALMFFIALPFLFLRLRIFKTKK